MADASFLQDLSCETLSFAPKPSKTHWKIYFFDRQVIGLAFDTFQTTRHAPARAQKVNRQVIGHANGNATSCKGRCPITCLSTICHVRLLACPISAGMQVIGQLDTSGQQHKIVIAMAPPSRSACHTTAAAWPKARKSGRAFTSKVKRLRLYVRKLHIP